LPRSAGCGSIAGPAEAGNITCSPPSGYIGTDEITIGAGAGRRSSLPVTIALTVTPGAPETTLDPAFGPNGTTQSHTAEFQFSSPDAAATFECELDGLDLIGFVLFLLFVLLSSAILLRQ
jgi:hypothetical protein